MSFLEPFGANRNLASLARRYYWTAPVVMLLAMMIGLFEGAGIGLLIPLLSTFTAAAPAPHGTIMAFIERIAAGHAANERLVIVSLLILMFVALKCGFQILANIFASWVDGRIGQDIRTELSARLHAAGYVFFLAQDPARLVNVISTESWKASDAVRVLMTRIAAAGTVVVFSALLLLASWRLFLFVAIGGVITRLVQQRTESWLGELGRRTVVSNQVLVDRMLFTVFGARIMRIFNTQATEHERFRSTSDEVRRAILRTERLSGIQGPLLEAMHGVLFVVVLLIAVFSGTSLPLLAAFLVLMNRLQPHLRVLEQTGATLAAASAHFNEVEWLLDMRDKTSAPPGELPCPDSAGDVAFENVTYDYGLRNEPALNGVSFVLRRGRATALFGGSGAGKSTVVNLLCRLLEPTSGRITIAGRPLSSIDASDWLSRIAIAGQDIDLIDGTIAENVAYGNPNLDQAHIRDALRTAHATFIDQLPNGVETLVGQRGISLSGGQRQRIGLARALARKPDLLILDEATNAVDYETEAGILESVQAVREHMSIVVISHRTSTLGFCDDAIVLERGRVVRSGPLEADMLAGAAS